MAEVLPAYDAVIHALNTRGWIVSDDLIPPAWITELRATAQTLWDAGRYEPGEFGRGKDGRKPEVRGDSICWVAPDSDLAQQAFFRWMAGFRGVLNQHFGMGLRSQEFHFARYPAGLGYQKHIDQHRGTNYRKISVVLYLNEDWDDAGGGEFALYEPKNPDLEIRRFAPRGGRIAIFVSWMMPHAVLPCRATRWSIAGWLRTDDIPGTPA